MIVMNKRIKKKLSKRSAILLKRLCLVHYDNVVIATEDDGHLSNIYCCYCYFQYDYELGYCDDWITMSCYDRLVDIYIILTSVYSIESRYLRDAVCVDRPKNASQIFGWFNRFYDHLDTGKLKIFESY